jgi:hypothetical protein
MADTNVSSAFSATGVLEFFMSSGVPGNVSGNKIMQIDGTNNGVNFQLASTAAAAGNSQATNFGVALKFIDNTGTVYYVPAKVTSVW